MQIMTARTLSVHVVLNCVTFPQILYDVVLYTLGISLPVKFFPSITLINYASSFRKMQLGPMSNARDQHEYRHKWVEIGPSYLLIENGDLSFCLFIYLFIFRNSALQRTFRESFKKIHWQLLFLRNQLKFCSDQYDLKRSVIYRIAGQAVSNQPFC